MGKSRASGSLLFIPHSGFFLFFILNTILNFLDSGGFSNLPIRVRVMVRVRDRVRVRFRVKVRIRVRFRVRVRFRLSDLEFANSVMNRTSKYPYVRR